MAYSLPEQPEVRRAPKKSMRNEKKKTHPAKRVFQIVFTLLLLFAVGGVFASNLVLPRLQRIEIPKDDASLGIQENKNLNIESEAVKEYIEAKKKAISILLIGVDGEGYEGVRSDVMMILTINEDDGMSLTSVQRDLLAYSPYRDSLDKMNHNFMYGGAPEVLRALNTNLDLDIRDFVVFDFKALALLVDVVGGVEVHVDESEFSDMAVSGVYLDSPGTQILNGEQALMYARVRYNSGGDTGRNERQREILKYIFTKAKSLSYGQLYDMAMKVLPAIQTSYGYSDVPTMLKMYQGMKGSGDFEEHSFPFEQAEATLGDTWYAVPYTLSSNVITLHELLYGYDGYTPSDTVADISERISNYSGYY